MTNDLFPGSPALRVRALELANGFSTDTSDVIKKADAYYRFMCGEAASKKPATHSNLTIKEAKAKRKKGA